jgi:hypothetical protein
MISSEDSIRDVLAKSVPLPASSGGDWKDVLFRSGISARAVWIPRAVYAVVLATVVASLLAATPLGAAIARGFGDFSGWLNGKAGTPVSNSERRTIELESLLSWDLFPKGTKLKRLITLTRGGIDYKLYGYRAGGMFCLRLLASRALLAQTSCAPRSDLRLKRKPVLPLYINAPVVVQKKIDPGTMAQVTKSSVSFGIVSDGVTTVRASTRSGGLLGVVAADSFLIVNPNVGDRVRSISARDAAGDEIKIPIAGPPKYEPFDTGALMNKPPSGPAFQMAKRQIKGVKIGWLERREPRGTAVPPSFTDFEPGTTFRRLLAPDPTGVVRIEVSLHRNGHICVGIMSPQSEMGGDGAWCLDRKLLNWGGWGDASTANFLWRQPVTMTEGDQYVINAGLVDDHVRRMMLLLVNGARIPVPVRDNAFVYMVPRTEYPVLLLAYDSANRIVGIERDTGKYNGFVESSGPAVTTFFPAAPEKARPIVFEQSKSVYEFKQAGQSFYDVIVLMKNRSNKTVVEINPSLGTQPKGNEGMSGITLTPVATILPHSESLLVYPYFGVPSTVSKDRIDVEIDSFQTRDGARSPVSFSQLRYGRSPGTSRPKCTISGVISNRFTKKRENLQLNVAGFVNDRLFSGGSTSVDTVFPGRDTAFKVDFFNSAMCPQGLDRIGVYPNLSEDEIYNP